MPNPSQKLDLRAMLWQKRLLPRSALSQNLRQQKPNPAHLANHATQMPAAELNRRGLKFVVLSAAMMFGILRANHNARVAKSQLEHVPHAVVLKMIAQHARHANTTTRHRLAHHVPVVMMQQVVHHVHIEMKHLHAHLALSAKKFMHQSRAYHARSLRPNA
jgi:hypothetical protein